VDIAYGTKSGPANIQPTCWQAVGKFPSFSGLTQLREVVDQGESWEGVKRILAEMEELLLSGSNVAA